MMVRVRVFGCQRAQRRSQTRSFTDCNRVVRVPVALPIGKYISKVLMQRATERNIENLQTATDGEKRLVLLEGFAHHCNLELVVFVDDSIDGFIAAGVPVTLAMSPPP